VRECFFIADEDCHK